MVPVSEAANLEELNERFFGSVFLTGITGWRGGSDSERVV